MHGAMMWKQIVSTRSLATARLSQLGTQLGRWWMRELLSLLPEEWAHWLMGPGEFRVMLRPDDSFVEIRLETGQGASLDSRQVPWTEYSPRLIDDFLGPRHIRRQDAALAIVLRVDQFFERKFILPVQAARSLDQIVARDLTQKTPFKLENIYYDYTVVEDHGKLTVGQRLTKREIVHAAATLLELDVSDVKFVVTDSVQYAPHGRTTIALRRGHARHDSWVRRAAAALTASCLMLALIGGGLRYWRQESDFDELRLQLATASRLAREVRDTFAKLEHRHTAIIHVLTEKQYGPSVLGIWEETTRLLPADSWLTELSISAGLASQGQRISMTGLSSAAAKLVGTFDRSDLFQDASLSSGIAVDPVEHRERFTLQAAIRPIIKSTEP